MSDETGRDAANPITDPQGTSGLDPTSVTPSGTNQAGEGAAEALGIQQTAEGSFKEPDKFKDKSREHVLRSYQDLESQYHKRDEEVSQLRTFTEAMAPFFNRNPDGSLAWKKDMVSRLADELGVTKEKVQMELEAQKQAPTPEQENEQFIEQFQQKPKQLLKDEVSDAVKSVIQEYVVPLQKDLEAQKYDKWVVNMRSKYTDFDKWSTKVGEFMTTHKFPVDSEKALEIAYLTTKTINGAMVDRASAEAETARYQSALSEIRPGASLQQPTNEESATVEQILGMENTGTRQGDSLHSLFGKRSLKPNPTT